MKEDGYWIIRFLLLMILLSIVLVSWGANKGSDLDIYMILTTIGSAFLGVSATLYLDRIISKKSKDNMLLVLEKNMKDIRRAISHDNILTSDKDSLDKIIGIWHQYNITKKDDRYFWVHVIYDVKSTSMGEVSFDVEYEDNDGGVVSYAYSGFIRDSRVVLSGRALNSTQPCFIEIWPHLTNRAAKYHCGFCINESWDSDETLIPCIMSRNVLIDENDIDIDDKLDKLWRKGAKSINLSILPRVINLEKGGFYDD